MINDAQDPGDDFDEVVQFDRLSGALENFSDEIRKGRPPPILIEENLRVEFVGEFFYLRKSVGRGLSSTPLGESAKNGVLIISLGFEFSTTV
jgi:hypothetical protein